MGDLLTSILLLVLLFIAMANTKKVIQYSGILGAILMYAFIIACIIGKFMQYLGIIPSILNYSN
jgi:hypothetical protein